MNPVSLQMGCDIAHGKCQFAKHPSVEQGTIFDGTDSFSGCQRCRAQPLRHERDPLAVWRPRRAALDPVVIGQAAQRLADAGAIFAERPEAMQLRYLAALQTIAGERASTIVLPLPMDLLTKLKG